jgi:drug/metabolite transporter (DMT)-like permease
MNAALLALVLGSAVLHAVWNAWLKLRQDANAAGVWVVAGAAVWSALLAWCTGETGIPNSALPWTLGAGAVEGVYFVALLTAMHHLPLPLAYGVSRGAGVLLSWPIALYFLGETASPAGLLGAALLSAGLGLTALEQVSSPPQAHVRHGAVATVFAALSIAAYPLVYQQALRAGAPPFSLFASSLAISLPVQIAWLGRNAATRLRAERSTDAPTLFFAATLCAASFLMLLWALKTGGAAHLSALRNTSVLIATALAARHQPLTRLDGLRGTLVTVGAVLVAW